MDETLRIIDNLGEDVRQASLKQVLENGSCTCIMELFGVYIKFVRGGNGNLWTFWLSEGLHGHHRDFAGTHPSIHIWRLDDTPDIRTP